VARKIIKPVYNTGENEEDKIINSYYCGQILTLHYLLQYIFKLKYPLKYVLRWIEARYCYLIHQYPNFYNELIKNDKELGPEARKAYDVVFHDMQKHYKQLFEDEDRPL